MADRSAVGTCAPFVEARGSHRFVQFWRLGRSTPTAAP